MTLADSQQGNQDLTLTAARNWHLLTAGMRLEAGSSLGPLVESPAQRTSWCLPCEMLSKELSEAHLNFWSTQL